MKPVDTGGTIYIRVDGSIDPSTANITTADNLTYTFTDNNCDRVVVERDNVVIDGMGYSLSGSEGPGITLSDRENVTIQNVTIGVFFVGMMLDDSTYCTVSGNDIKDNAWGIWLEDSASNTVSNNNIENVGMGIQLFNCSSTRVSGNLVNARTWGIGLGIYSSSNEIFENTIFVRTRLFQAPAHAITLTDSSQNRFYHNDIYGPLYISNATNMWDDGAGKGNYWSRYRGKDQDNNGIGDTPLVIDASNQDNYPVMQPIHPQGISITPFWALWWFWVIIAVVIIALVVAIHLLRKGKPQKTQVPPFKRKL